LGQRILIVDDERVLRIVVKQMLIHCGRGYVVDGACDGHEAMTLIRSAEYDLVIADILMPVMDGVELLRMLRKERPGLPVVMVTAVGDEGFILNCFANGAWDYLMKPLDVRYLRTTIRRALVASATMDSLPQDMYVNARDSGTLELTAASDFEYVHRFRRFTEVLLRAKLPSAVREDIRMAIEEIGKNAIEWGNRHERCKRVRLAYCLETDRITFRIEDEGDGFCRATIPDPSLDPLGHVAQREKEGKRPGGYGIHIISSVMDQVRYNDKGNAVVMTKFLTGPGRNGAMPN
jgi:CheY-like chemotaxis protein/anti-sigma regulatory factor (Ser/Thr protein kinase)